MSWFTPENSSVPANRTKPSIGVQKIDRSPSMQVTASGGVPGRAGSRSRWYPFAAWSGSRSPACRISASEYAPVARTTASASTSSPVPVRTPAAAPPRISISRTSVPGRTDTPYRPAASASSTTNR